MRDLICSASFGGLLAICGLYWTNWRFWVVLVATIAWKEIMRGQKR